MSDRRPVTPEVAGSIPSLPLFAYEGGARSAPHRVASGRTFLRKGRVVRLDIATAELSRSRPDERLLLKVYGGHAGFVVALTGGLGKLRVDARHVVNCQLDVDRPSIPLEVRAALRPGDRNQIVALRQHPRNRQLRRRDALFRGDLAYRCRPPVAKRTLG